MIHFLYKLKRGDIIKQFTTSDRLKQIMRERNLKQVDILNMARPHCKEHNVKLNKSDLSQYISGRSDPKQDKLTILGMALNVNPVWLMGFDVPIAPISYDDTPPSVDRCGNRRPNNLDTRSSEEKFYDQVRRNMKYLRENVLHMTIEDFSMHFIMTSEMYRKVENGEVDFNTLAVSDITDKYNVNYNWLMFSQLPIFEKVSPSRLDELSKEYALGDKSILLLEKFLNFDNSRREMLSKTLLEMFDVIKVTPAYVEQIVPVEAPKDIVVYTAARSTNNQEPEHKTLTPEEYNELNDKLKKAPKVESEEDL